MDEQTSKIELSDLKLEMRCLSESLTMVAQQLEELHLVLKESETLSKADSNLSR